MSISLSNAKEKNFAKRSKEGQEEGNDKFSSFSTNTAAGLMCLL